MNRARLACIRKLFSGASRFHCSAFGHGFTWGPPEMAQLLIDLEDGYRTPGEKGDPAERYYLGVIATRAVRRNAHLLLDGQQRLAAITMILACIRDRTDDARLRKRLDAMLFVHPVFGASGPRLNLHADDQPWFAARILEPGATLRLPQHAPQGGQRNLLLSARFFARAFAAYSQDNLNLLAGFILRHTAVVVSQGVEHATFHNIYVNMNQPAANDAPPAPARAHQPAA